MNRTQTLASWAALWAAAAALFVIAGKTDPGNVLLLILGALLIGACLLWGRE